MSRIRTAARTLLRGVRRSKGLIGLRIGQIASDRPLSRWSGFDRGTPIDRFYIEHFLADHAEDIHGRVLEIGGDAYSRRFGGNRVERQDVLHVDDSNPAATIVGDLAGSGLLPAGSFDCVIATQTLQYVFDVEAALENLKSALRPGGVALLTVPALAPVAPDEWRDHFYWRFTLPSLRRLIEGSFGDRSAKIGACGNLYAASLFLHGACAEEADARKLAPTHADFAVVLTARVST